MSEKINDGGPAFPVSTSDPRIGHQDGYGTWQFPGLSVRDYFAAKALCGMEITAEGTMGGSFFYSPSALATRAYAIADAMLIERDKNAK